MLDWPHDIFSKIDVLLPLIVAHALSVVGAIAILVVGVWLANRVDRIVVRMMSRTPQFDAMLRHFFGSLARYAILTVTVLAVLSQFGIETTSIVAVLGAAGLAVGLALQGTLSHLAAGVMLLMFRPFRIGDKVTVGGIQGTVKTLTLFWTELATDDNVQIIVPNGGIWGQPLRNFTAYPVQPKAGEVRVPLDESVDPTAVLETVRALALEQSHVVKDPAPAVTLDRSRPERGLEVVVGFNAPEADIPLGRTELIQAIHAALGANAEKPTAEPLAPT